MTLFKEGAHFTPAEAMCDFTRARVAEAAGAQGDILVVSQFFNAPVVQYSAIDIYNAYGYRAAALLSVTGTMNVDHWLAVIVAQRT